MEVHHHPEVEKKNFKQYLLEGLMIFLAVTMGFFAESLRENITNHQREKELMVSLLSDLKNDSAVLKRNILFTDYLIKGDDTLRNTLYEDVTKVDIVALYRMHTSYARKIGVTFSDQTSSQLKAGGMSMIKNERIASAITKYWSRIKAIEFVTDNYNAKANNAAELTYGIFNSKFERQYWVDSNNMPHIDIDPAARLMIADDKLLINYANRLNTMRSILNFYYEDISSQYRAAIGLIALIKKEYHLE